jgi:hypothetical protein
MLTGGVEVAGTPADVKPGVRILPLLVWFVGPLLELGGLFVIYAGMPDLSEDAAFGTPATQILTGLALVVTVAGSALAWKGVSGTARIAVAVALFVAAGLTTTLGIAFALGGSLAVFALLMAHATLSIVMIGRAVLNPSTLGGR